MTYAQLLGSVSGGSGRLGSDTSILTPILLLGAVILFALAIKLLKNEQDSEPWEDPAE